MSKKLKIVSTFGLCDTRCEARKNEPYRHIKVGSASCWKDCQYFGGYTSILEEEIYCNHPFHKK